MHHRLTLALLALLSTGIGASCANVGFGCTEIGCDSAFQVNFVGLLAVSAHAMPLTIEACLDQECVTAKVQNGSTGDSSTCTGDAQDAEAACCAFDPPAPGVICSPTFGGPVSIRFPLLGGDDFVDGPHTIKATVRDKDGTVLLDAQQTGTTTSSTPNGPECGPTCHSGSVTFGPPAE